MKLSEKTLSTVRVGYLHANGKLALVHEQKHKQAGTVQWATLHELPQLACRFTGRLVLHNRAAVRLVLSARAIRAAEPRLEHGSDNTRRLGIPYGYVSLQIGPTEFEDCVHVPVFSNLVTSDFTVQPEHEWQEPDSPTRWAGYPVAENVRQPA